MTIKKILILTMLFGFLSGCGGDDNDATPKPGPTPTPPILTLPKGPITLTVTGVVSLLDEVKAPLSEVDVSIGRLTTKTDINGNFLISNVNAKTNEKLLVSFSKVGYASNQRYIVVGDESMDTAYSVGASLSAFQSSTMVDPSTVNQLEIPDPLNQNNAPLASLHFPANSIGASNNVEVNVVVGDPSSKMGQELFPGDYSAIDSGETSADTLLESVAFLDITVMDQGQQLTNLSAPADVEVKLPEVYQINGSLSGTYDANDAAKNSIEWWSYNNVKGAWIREDADPSTTEIDNAIVIADSNGVLYAKAKIMHFSFWNADRPITQHACVCVNVIDANGNPLVGAKVTAQGTTYNGASTPVLTDKDGKACVNVKRSIDSTVLEKFKLSVNNGGIDFVYDVTSAAEGNVATNEIFSPTEQGSTLDGSGFCKTLGNSLPISFGSSITGTVSFEGGTPVANQKVYSSYGLSAITNADGVYTLQAPINSPVNISVAGTLSQRVTVPNASPLTVDFIIPNQAPVISALTRTPAGNVTSNTVVTLAVAATDPEGNTLNYVWGSTTGSLNASTGDTVQWTAPAGQGTAVVSVTASDGVRDTTNSVTIIYGSSTPAAGNLKITFRESVRTNIPVVGVTAAIYNADNKTILTSRVSGSDGVVDFGQIDRKISLTVAYSRESATKNFIETFIDINPVDAVYYLDELSNSFGCGTQLGSITANGFSTGTTSASIEPISSFSAVDPTGTATISTPTYCDDDQQTDGNISLLALGVDMQSMATNYGFLVDQTTNASNFTLTAATAFTSYEYGSIAGSNVTNLYVEGTRKGVIYELTGPLGSIGMIPSSGVIPVAIGFPVDIYRYIGIEDLGAAAGFHIKGVIRQTASLPTTIMPEISDLDITTATYSDASKTIAWTLGGNSPRDFIDVSLSSKSFAPSGTFMAEIWSFSLSSTSSGLTLPDLPAPANSWVDVPNLNPVDFCASVDVLEGDFINGFDEYIAELVGGSTNIDTLPYVVNIASRDVEGACLTASASQSLRTTIASPKNIDIGSSIRRLNTRFNRY